MLAYVALRPAQGSHPIHDGLHFGDSDGTRDLQHQQRAVHARLSASVGDVLGALWAYCKPAMGVAWRLWLC